MRRADSDPMLLAVCALGIAQITAWGTAYYCLGVLAGPIGADTGWSRSFVYFGFTVSLLVMGAVSPGAGRADTHAMGYVGRSGGCPRGRSLPACCWCAWPCSRGRPP